MKIHRNKHKCQIWVCSHQSIRPLTVKTIVEIVKKFPYEIDFQCIWNDALISRSRNRAATMFLESDYEVMFFIDDDIYFNTDAFFHVLNHCLNGYEMIAGFYPTKPIVQCAHKLLPGTKVIVPSNQLPIEAKYISTGMMAIHRKVLEAMAKKHHLCYKGADKNDPMTSFYSLFEPYYYENQYLSEDWSFVQRAKDLGFKCYLDPFAYCIHFGWYAYGLLEGLRPKIPDNVSVEIVAESSDTIMKIPQEQSKNSENPVTKIIQSVLDKFTGGD